MPIYRVQAPNGKVYKVEGPENADPNTLYGFVQQQVEAEDVRRLQKEYGPGILQTFGQATKRGFQGLGSTITDIIPAMAGSALGFDEYAKEQLAEAEAKRAAREAEAPPVFRSYKEVEGLGDAAKFAAETIGEQVANIGTALIPGLGVGALGARGAAQAATKALTAQAAERGLAGAAAEQFVAQGLKAAAPQLAARAATGQNVGVFLGSYALNAPEVFQNIYENTGELAPGASALFSVASAALDSVLPATLAKNLTGPVKAGIVEKILEKSGMDKGLLRSVTAGTITGVPTEGLTEGAQEAISIFAEKFVGDNPQIFGSKEWGRIMESAVKGAVAGGAFGGVGGAAERAKAASERRQAYADALERRGERQLAAEVRRQDAEIMALQEQEQQMSLPGIEAAPATGLYPAKQIAKEEKPAKVKELKGKQAELFTPEGELTPELTKQSERDIKAGINKQRLAAQREAAEVKEAQDKLKKALSELTDVPKDLVALAKAPSPLAGTLTQVQGEMDTLAAKRGPKPTAPAAPVAEAVPAAEVGQPDLFTAPVTETAPAPAPAPVTLGTMPTVIGSDSSALKTFGKMFGIGPTARILRADGPLAGKDISKPEDAAEVKRVLEAYASDKPATGAAEKIDAYLKRPEFQGVTDVTAQPVEQPSGAGAGVVGEPDTGVAPGVTAGLEPSGVVSTEPDVGVPAVGEGAGPAPVEEAAAPAEVVAETPAEAPAAPAPTEVVTEAPAEPGKKAKADLAKAERGREEAVKEQANFIKEVDDNANALLVSRLRELGQDAGLKDVDLPSEDYRGTEAHNILRLPYLFSQYNDSVEMLRQSMGTPQEQKNRDQIQQIEEAITQSGPEAAQVFQQLQAMPAKQQTAFISQLNRIGRQTFDQYAQDLVAKKKAEIAEKGEAKTKKAAKPEFTEDEILERLTEKLGESKVGRAAAKAGKKFWLPTYQGPTFDDSQQAMADSGDVKGLLRSLINQTTDPIIKQILRRIQSLNLNTKLVLGDPEGGINTNTPAFKNWFGRSQLVDAQGNPLVVYHGSPSNRIEAFDPNRIGESGHAALGPGFYAGWFGYARDYNGSDTRSVTPLYARIETPLYFDDELFTPNLPEANAANMAAYQKVRAVDPQLADAVFVIDEGRVAGIRAGKENLQNYLRVLDVAGIDGVIDKSERTGEVHQVMVRNPAQFKHATENLGKYSPDDPRLRYAANKAGSYDPATNTITLSPTNGLNAHTFIHEITHAAISNVLANTNHPLTKEFQQFFIQIQDRLGAAYGAQDLQEFAAELVGNPEFQALLRSIKAPRSGSLFNRIMQSIAEFFGFKGKSAFDEGVKFIEDAINISGDVEPVASQKMFLGNPASSFSTVGRIGQSMPGLVDNTIERTKNFLANLKDVGALQAGLGMLRLDNLNTLYSKELPSLQKLIDAMEKRNGTQEQRIKAVNTNYKQFVEVQKKFPQAMERMGDMAIDARLAEVDILNPDFQPTAAQQAEYSRLRQIFNSLPKEVQGVYRTMRKDYDRSLTEYRNILLKSVSPTLAQRLASEFQNLKGVVGYVPFLRHGDFWVEYADPQTGERAASAFESVRERQQFIDTVLTPQGIKHRAYQNLQSISFDAQGVPPTSFIGRVMNDLKAKGADQSQLDSVYQAYLTLFPGQSILKQFMKSKNVRGMERDMVRNYGDIMVRWSRKLANSEYMPQINQALSEIAVQGEQAGSLQVEEAAKGVLRQGDFFRNPTYGSMVNAAVQFSYFEYIAGNISSALINVTSLPMLVWPLLSGKFGFAQTSSAMMAASRTAINGMEKDPRYKNLYQTLMDHGQLEHTMSREVLEGRRETTGQYFGLYGKMMDALSIPFAATERYNRGVTAIAAYDLAKAQGMSEEKAVRYALNTVKDIHTSGMAATAPRWMQHPVGRVFFTFKSFVWNSAFVVARAFYNAYKGETPEVRRAAQRQLLGMYGMTMAFAGVKGMPFYGAASTLATMLNAMFGDDEPFDFDEEMRKFFGELFYKGFFNYFTNIELANRAGIATDLIYRDDPRGVAEHGYVLSAMQQAFGPLGSYAVNAERGIKAMADGQVMRGVESLLPSWARNGLKGARYMTEGATTLKGDPVVEDVSAYNSLMQVIGFAPADLSTTYEKLSAAKAYEREVNSKRVQLLNRYDMARQAGDSDMAMETREMIRDFNEMFPAKKITAETLAKSAAARKAAEKQMINGVRFDKSLMPEIREKFFSDEEEE